MFKYKYEKILLLKSEHEDECKLKLGRAISEYEAVDSDLTSVRAKYEEFTKSLCTVGSVKSAASYEIAQMNKLYFKDEIVRLEQLLIQANQNIMIARNELLESTKEKKKYEKLKEKAREDHLFKLEKADSELIEEFVSNKITNVKI